MTDNKFVNERIHDLEVSGLMGEITLPIYLEDEHLAVYYEKMAETSEKLDRKSETGSRDFFLSVRDTLGWQFLTVKHIPIAIDFPGITIEDIRANRCFPAFRLAVYAICRKLIDDAVNVPKL